MSDADLGEKFGSGSWGEGHWGHLPWGAEMVRGNFRKMVNGQGKSFQKNVNSGAMLKLCLKAQMMCVLKFRISIFFKKKANQNPHVQMDFSDRPESAKLRSSKSRPKFYHTYCSYCDATIQA